MKIQFPHISTWTHTYRRASAFVALISGLIGCVLLLLVWMHPEGKEENIRTLWLIDVSLSMGTYESVGEGEKSRIQLLKDTLVPLIDAGRSEEDSVVIFSRDTRTVSPFSHDHRTVANLLLSVPLMKYQGGTDLSHALSHTLNALKQDKQIPSRVIMLTDGGDDLGSCGEHPCKWSDFQDIPLTIIGIGSSHGGKIPIGDDIWGNPLYKTYNGEIVISKRNDRNLHNFASMVGGELILIDPTRMDTLGEILGERSSLLGGWRDFYLFLSLIFILLALFFPRFQRAKIYEYISQP